MIKYLIIIGTLLIGSLVSAQVLQPDDFLIKVNEDADVVVEAKTIKRDTLTISEDESYYISTLEVIQIFKGEIATKTFKLKTKRNLMNERGMVSISSGGPWSPVLNYSYLLFLKQDKDCFRPRGVFTYSPPTVPIYEKDVYGLQLYFKSLLSFYNFLTPLKGFTVPKCYLDSARYAKPPEKDPFQDPEYLKLIEIRSKGRKEAMEKERIRIEHLMKIMEENKKNKSKTRKGDTGALPMAAPTLAVSITNPGITYISGSSTTLDFDVVIQPSQPIYLHNVFFKLKYNKFAFGSQIVSKGLITSKAYPPFINATYGNATESINDDLNNEDEVNVSLGVKYGLTSFARTLVSTIPTKVFRISMIVGNCNELANIGAGDLSIADLLTSYTPTSTGGYSTVAQFSAVNFNLSLAPNPDLCKPNITSVSPTTITAGTNSKLVIEGFGFGAVQGKGVVQLKNAELNGSKYIEYNDPIDVKWTDNRIEYTVPSYVEAFPGEAKPSSGSGKVVIKENTGRSSTEKFDITIPYSILNVYSVSEQKKYFVVPVQSDGGKNGRITFYPTKELSENGSYITIITKAMEELSCRTTVNFELAPLSLDNSKGYVDKDKFSVISLTDGSIFSDPRTLIETSRQTTQVCIRDGQQWYINNETDIAINKTIKWSVTSKNQNVESGAYDLYQAIMHELAHAAGLGHVVSDIELMKPYLSTGPTPTNNRFNYDNFPNDNSINGIKWLLNEGDKYNYNASNCASFYKMTRKGLCGITSIEESNNTVFTIKNNPVEEQNLYILTPTDLHGTLVNYNVINVQGKVIGKGTITVSSEMEISMSNATPGMYFVLLDDFNGKNYSVKVMKQ